VAISQLTRNPLNPLTVLAWKGKRHVKAIFNLVSHINRDHLVRRRFGLSVGAEYRHTPGNISTRETTKRNEYARRILVQWPYDAPRVHIASS
jgi:hypothetical protein